MRPRGGTDWYARKLTALGWDVGIVNSGSATLKEEGSISFLIANDGDLGIFERTDVRKAGNRNVGN
jgi:hypothetical protein